MKKTVFLTVMLAAMFSAAVAQQSYRYVTPIVVECKQFNVQVLRDSAANETEYVAQLNALMKDLLDEKSEIDNTTKGLKLERNLYNSLLSSYKTRKAQLEKAQKNADSEIKTYESLLKDLQKQNDIIRKMNTTNGTAVKDNATRLADKETVYRSEMNQLTNYRNDLKKHANEELNSTFTMLNDYLIELTDKETRLKNLASQNKTNIDIVKSALKAVK